MAYPSVSGANFVGGTDWDGFNERSSGAMNYIPTLYAGELLLKFYETATLTQVSNTKYEGMIRSQGDTVIIRGCPDITISAHTKGMALDYEAPEAPSITLAIDKGLYWAFVTDDVDTVQTDIDSFVSKWTDDASLKLRDEVETIVYEEILDDADFATANKGSTAGVITSNIDIGAALAPVELTATNVWTKFIDCGVVLNQQKVPKEGRFFLVDSITAGLVKKCEFLASADKMGGSSSVRTGEIGQLDKFTIYETDNLYSEDDLGANGSGGSTTHCTNNLFGTKDAITFATQLVKSEQLPNPKGFGTLFRGLQVFGFKLVAPEALGVLYSTCETPVVD